ncbi:MAG TPA: hypothetical protein VEU47_11180 [Candidatus Cybelea sp.]|nr:hypothetical protein [Candidatus Cybelea sp.]
MADTSVLGITERRSGISLPLLVGLGVFVLGLVFATKRLEDPDILMHIVAGRWMIAHVALPHADFLSYTATGAAWVTHEWIGEIATALAYDAAGWHGLVTLAAFCFALSFALFARALLRVYRPSHALIVTLAALPVIVPHWLARPHVFAMPILLLWLSLLVEARRENRAPPLWAALLMVPWVNLHGSFLIGLGMAGVLWLEAMLTTDGEAERIRAATAWIAFLAASFAATLVTPLGLEAYLLPLRLMHMKFALSMLVEWKSFDFQTVPPLTVWLLLVLGIALRQGLRLPLSRLLIVLLLLHMALKYARHAEMLVLAGPMLAGPALAPQLRAAGGAAFARLDRWLGDLAAPAGGAAMLSAAILMLTACLVATRTPIAMPERYTPIAAVRAVEEHGIPGPVLNAYNFGDYLIFSGIPTFIDGRADMYDDAFIERHYHAVYGESDQLPALLAEYHVAWTLFEADSPAVVQLDRMPGWRRLYSDDVAVVHIRDDAK